MSEFIDNPVYILNFEPTSHISHGTKYSCLMIIIKTILELFMKGVNWFFFKIFKLKRKKNLQFRIILSSFMASASNYHSLFILFSFFFSLFFHSFPLNFKQNTLPQLQFHSPSADHSISKSDQHLAYTLYQ